MKIVFEKPKKKKKLNNLKHFQKINNNNLKY
jgi:hypothetical protein